MALSVFQKQDIFFNKMIQDYKAGLISNPVFVPYFEWKMGDRGVKSISKHDAWDMIQAAQEELIPLYDKHPDAYKTIDTFIDDDAWQMYKGYGEDKYLVSYLEQIDEELTYILPLLL